MIRGQFNFCFPQVENVLIVVRISVCQCLPVPDLSINFLVLSPLNLWRATRGAVADCPSSPSPSFHPSIFYWVIWISSESSGISNMRNWNKGGFFANFISHIPCTIYAECYKFTGRFCEHLIRIYLLSVHMRCYLTGLFNMILHWRENCCRFGACNAVNKPRSERNSTS